MTYSPSFSPSTKKKATSKFPQIQRILFKKSFSSSSTKDTSLTKRRETIFKKAHELSTLCGIEVCVICYGPDGELNTWPEDREKVKDMARRYSELSEEKRQKARVNLREFLEKINKDDSTKSSINHNYNDFKKPKFGSNFKNPDWDPRIEGYSEEQLTELYEYLKSKHSRIQQRFRSVVEAREQRNMAYQAQRMTTDTQNHLQQHSNQFLMHPLNYGNNTLSQTLDSTSAFNQTQSLAPIPSHLRIYHNEFQNPNMHSFNSFNNMNVEDYLSSLGVQVTDMNGFQNIYGHNNNGVSNQLVQFLTQTAAAAAPNFQFGSVYPNY